MSRRRGLWLSLASVALFLLAGRAAAGAYAEYRWFDALGAVDVWRLQVGQAFTLRLLAFAVGTIIAFVNLWAVRHSVVSLVMPRRIGNIEIGEEVPPRSLMTIVAAVAVAMGVGFAVPASAWESFALARYGVQFNETDPYFNTDLGFFVYQLPFERAAYAWMTSVTVIVSAVVVTCYALTPSLRWERNRLHVSTYVRRHISLLGGGALALLAWLFRLDAFGLLSRGSGANGAFASVDEQLGIPVSILLQFVSLGAAFVVAWSGWTGQSRVALAVVTAVLLLTPTMRYVLPAAVRWASAPVDPALRERQYESVRASYTRRAFGVDRIRLLPATQALASPADAVLSGVWDPAALATALERSRRRAPVITPQSLGGSLAGPVFTAVEGPVGIDVATATSWALVRSLASVTDERGGIARVDAAGRYPLEDELLPPVLVHPGARGVVVAQDTAGRMAAPALRSFGARLAEAWSQQNYRLLAAGSPAARVIRRRDVRERVAAIAPFFAVGRSVFPVVHGDSLMWAAELYSWTRAYPLSRRLPLEAGDVSYFQHAGTALVHAHTGRVVILPVGNPDPIARTWLSRIRGALTPVGGLPASLVALLPPAIDGAVLQADAFAAYGLRGEAGIRRHIPSLDGSDTLAASLDPTLVWLPTAAAVAWPVPIVDPRDRVAGVLLAIGGLERGTKWHPMPDNTVQWGAMLDQLSRAGAGTPARAGESRAAGRVRLLPLSGGEMLAVQPFYGWPREGPPFVSRVAVMVGDSARADGTLAAALGAPAPIGPAPTTPEAQRDRLRTLYAEMRAALQRNDWAAFGAAFDALGAILNRR